MATTDRQSVRRYRPLKVCNFYMQILLYRRECYSDSGKVGQVKEHGRAAIQGLSQYALIDHRVFAVRESRHTRRQECRMDSCGASHRAKIAVSR